ncbi:MAG: hypothetical protein M1541_04955, partial [Acidobacteria bacterium]|nr:hypothetical protein [Acidobacteriota bacterium]
MKTILLIACLASSALAQLIPTPFKGYTSGEQEPPHCTPGVTPLNYNTVDHLLKRCIAEDTWGVIPYLDSSTGGSLGHKLLSATHSDTSAATAVRGDLITAQGASPTWKRLAKGSQYQSLIMGASEPAWTSLSLASTQFANQGTASTVLHGNAAGNPSWANVTPSDFANQTPNS